MDYCLSLRSVVASITVSLSFKDIIIFVCFWNTFVLKRSLPDLLERPGRTCSDKINLTNAIHCHNEKINMFYIQDTFKEHYLIWKNF